ncbi:MAG: CHASE2 domain-containing protein [Pseudomonadota bacterium]
MTPLARLISFIAAMLLALALGLAPQRFSTQLLTPNWMPQQIVQLIETSNDVQVALMADQLDAEHPDIALILITDETLKDLPYTSPIDRELLAKLVTATANLAPRAIALDFLFDRATEAAKDARLIETLQALSVPVVLGAADQRFAMADRNRAWQQDFLQRAGRPVGYLNLQYDAQEASGDAIIRYRAAPASDERYRLSFAGQIAQVAHATPITGERPTSRSATNDLESPNRRIASRRIAWLAEPVSGETFLTVDADAVLAAAADPAGVLAIALSAQLADRIVLIGGDFPGRDRHPTPITALAGGDMLGLNVHAHSVAGLLDGRELHDFATLPTQIVVGILAALGWLIANLSYSRQRTFAWIMSLATAAIVALGLVSLYTLREVIPLALFVAVFLGTALVTRVALNLTRQFLLSRQ